MTGAGAGSGHKPKPGMRADFPWWLVAVLVLGAAGAAGMATNPVYASIVATLLGGLWVTIWVTAVAFGLSTGLGLLLAAGLVSRHVLLRQLARFYVEILRGVPMLVLLLYVAFVLAPALVAGWNALTGPLGLAPVAVRDFPLVWRAIVALALGYSAFIAEVFRAGIAAVDKGQIEAAKALGLAPASGSASWSCRRRSARSCRRSATTSSPSSRTAPLSRSSASPTSPSSARSMRRGPSASSRPIMSSPSST